MPEETPASYSYCPPETLAKVLTFLAPVLTRPHNPSVDFPSLVTSAKSRARPRAVILFRMDYVVWRKVKILRNYDVMTHLILNLGEWGMMDLALKLVTEDDVDAPAIAPTTANPHNQEGPR